MKTVDKILQKCQNESMTITIKKLETDLEIAAYWEKKHEYDQRDLYPNVELGPDETQAEFEAYFDGPEYYQAIMDAHRERNLQFVFMYRDGRYLGFALYKVYTPDLDTDYIGEAMLMEFCIEPRFRNHGLGAQAFAALEQVFRQEGGQYTSINVSNANNRRFWQRLGFEEFKLDEWGNPVYRKFL